ncbi:MAG: fasciclin domain-containing protein [Planctomycetota bacterium]
MRSTSSRRAAGAAALCFATSFLAGCHDDDNNGNVGPGITVPTFSQQLDLLGLTTLHTALDAAGLTDALQTGGPFTLFGPTDAAFAALPAGVLADLLLPQNQAALLALLNYHVLPGDLSAATLQGLQSAMTLETSDVRFDVAGGLFVNDARVTGPNNDTATGVVHVIDAVLFPPVSVIDTLNARGYTTFVAALDAAGLTGALNGGNFTVFAPSNDAFLALPPGVLADLLLPQNQAQLAALLQYHLVPGQVGASALVAQGDLATVLGPRQFYSVGVGGARVNGVVVDRFNIPATDGLIHGIDGVLSIPDDLVARAQALGFNTLASALTAANLTATLQGMGPFTLLAPTDAAFAALPPGVLDALLMDQQALANVLLYHVLPDAQQAREIRLETSVTTVQGGALVVNPVGGYLTFNGSANAVEVDAFASNGVLHTLDAVLLP